MISMNKDSEPIDSAAQDSLSQFAKLLKEFAKKVEVREDTASYWQLVFLQSKANGCSYRAENLPDLKWQWPKGTWFQEQRRHIASMPVNLPDTNEQLNPARSAC